MILELDQQLPNNFCTDHIRLGQIVLNLLANALKHTKEGLIKLTAEPVEKALGCYKICVEDSGIGINSDNIEKLFSHFTHIEFESRQKINPTHASLGLNIAYQLAELIGPTQGEQGIKVTSVPGQGSTFSFIIENKDMLTQRQEEQCRENSIQSNSLSYEIAEELTEGIKLKVFPGKGERLDSSISLPSEVPLLEECSCAKVLIVDDNPFNTMALETILSSLEIKSDAVYSGSGCLQKVKNRVNKGCCQECKPYSLIFMDQEMPEMSGIETVAEIRRLQSEGLIPFMKIIGCTAHKIKEEVDIFLASGLDQCIFKPVSISLIKNLLKDIL